VKANGKITLVIPAAGRGKRLFCGNGSTPKGMVPINGRPLLEYVLEAGMQTPIRDIVIILSPTGDSIKEYFGHTWRGIPIYYAIQDEPRGLADAVSCAEPLVAHLMLVINGDEIYVGGRVAEIFDYYQHRDANGVVGYLRTTAEDPRIRLGYGLDVDHDQRVQRLVEKPPCPWNDLLGVGVWLLGREYFRYFERTAIHEERGERDFVAVLQAMVADGRTIYGLDLDAEFVNVTVPEDIVRAEAALSRATWSSNMCLAATVGV